jgi:hypothetical protein
MARTSYSTCFDCGRQFRARWCQLTCSTCQNKGRSRSSSVYGGTAPATKQWVERHEVHSSDLERCYIVARKQDGTWGCSCPQWKFRRQQCKHIEEVLSRQLVTAEVTVTSAL